MGIFDEPKIDVYTPAANVTPSGLCVETATTRVRGPMNLSRSSGKQATRSSLLYSLDRDFSTRRTPAGMNRAEPSSLCSTSRHFGYFRFMTPSIQIGSDAIAI